MRGRALLIAGAASVGVGVEATGTIDVVPGFGNPQTAEAHHETACLQYNPQGKCIDEVTRPHAPTAEPGGEDPGEDPDNNTTVGTEEGTTIQGSNSQPQIDPTLAVFNGLVAAKAEAGECSVEEPMGSLELFTLIDDGDGKVDKRLERLSVWCVTHVANEDGSLRFPVVEILEEGEGADITHDEGHIDKIVAFGQRDYWASPAGVERKKEQAQNTASIAETLSSDIQGKIETASNEVTESTSMMINSGVSVTGPITDFETYRVQASTDEDFSLEDRKAYLEGLLDSVEGTDFAAVRTETDSAAETYARAQSRVANQNGRMNEFAGFDTQGFDGPAARVTDSQSDAQAALDDLDSSLNSPGDDDAPSLANQFTTAEEAVDASIDEEGNIIDGSPLAVAIAGISAELDTVEAEIQAHADAEAVAREAQEATDEATDSTVLVDTAEDENVDELAAGSSSDQTQSGTATSASEAESSSESNAARNVLFIGGSVVVLGLGGFAWRRRGGSRSLALRS